MSTDSSCRVNGDKMLYRRGEHGSPLPAGPAVGRAPPDPPKAGEAGR